MASAARATTAANGKARAKAKPKEVRRKFEVICPPSTVPLRVTMEVKGPEEVVSKVKVRSEWTPEFEE